MELKAETDYIRQIVNGNTGLFAYFVNGYSRSVYALIVKIVRVPEDAEELTQDVFFRVFEKLETFKGESKFSTWIFRISYNTAISFIRKRKMTYLAVDESVLNNLADDAVDGFLNQADDEALLLKLEVSLSWLEPDEQALVNLYYNQNLPVKELALVLGLTESNVKIKLHRIRKKLYILVNH
jgi:RNA polymerase sigma-70 factor (ECF subfamily)